MNASFRGTCDVIERPLAFVWAVVALTAAGAFAATQPMYPSVAGSYAASESYTMDVTDNLLGHKVLTGTGKGTVVLTQSGNRVSYKAIDLTSGKVNVTRIGTLTGNDLSISGPAAVSSPGITITKNTFTATGTVEDGRIVIHGSGTIVARQGTQVETILITSTATLTGDVMPANVGRIQVSALPTAGGTVAGNVGNGVYPTGTAVTLTANRARGYYLINWTEDGNVIGTGPKLDLNIAGSRILKANFGTVGAATYAGLFQSGLESAVQTVGYLSATFSTTSAFSATLRVLGMSHSLSGSFDLNWDFDRTIVRSGQASLVVHLHLDPATRALTGLVNTVGNAFSAEISLAPVPVTSRTNPTPYAGLFNVLLPPEAGTANPATPQGTGYLSLTILATGAVTAVGKLPDGTAISISSQIDAGLMVPLQKFLYVKGPSSYGGIFGSIGLHGTGTADDTCDGALHATKPVQTAAAYYEGGFDADLAVEGARYQYQSGAAALNATGVELSDGGIKALQPISQAITVSPTNAVSVALPNPAKVKITITASTGAFSGSFIHPSNGRSTTFGGLICKTPGDPVAAGFFLGPLVGGTGIAGNVVMSP